MKITTIKIVLLSLFFVVVGAFLKTLLPESNVHLVLYSSALCGGVISTLRFVKKQMLSKIH
jgi:uncharacterized membrane-anchored protein